MSKQSLEFLKTHHFRPPEKKQITVFLKNHFDMGSNKDLPEILGKETDDELKRYRDLHKGMQKKLLIFKIEFALHLLKHTNKKTLKSDGKFQTNCYDTTKKSLVYNGNFSELNANSKFFWLHYGREKYLELSFI